MPLYEYECLSDGSRFEVIQKFSDPPVTVCPHCGGAVKRLLSSPAIQFKGSGWYITDYARKGNSGSETGDKDKGKSASADKPSSESGSGTEKSSPQSTSAPSAGSSPSGTTGSSA